MSCYVADNKVTKVGFDGYINDFGRFFYNRNEWRELLRKDGLEIKDSTFKYLSVEPQLPDCRHIGADGVGYIAKDFYAFLKSIATPIKLEDNPMRNIKAALIKECNVTPITIVETDYHNHQVLAGAIAKELFKRDGRDLEARITHTDFYNKERGDTDVDKFKIVGFVFEQQIDYQEATRWIGYQRVMTKVDVEVWLNITTKDITVVATAAFERLKDDRFYKPDVLGVEFTNNQVNRLFPTLDSVGMRAFISTTNAGILKDYPLVLVEGDARMYDTGTTRKLVFSITEPEPEEVSE